MPGPQPGEKEGFFFADSESQQEEKGFAFLPTPTHTHFFGGKKADRESDGCESPSARHLAWRRGRERVGL